MSAERRREERVEVDGEVSLETPKPFRRVIQGALMDVSAHGFRASHSDHELAPGDKVRFSHPFGAGEATVVWTRILEGQTTSGFLVVEAPRAVQ